MYIRIFGPFSDFDLPVFGRNKHTVEHIDISARVCSGSLDDAFAMGLEVGRDWEDLWGAAESTYIIAC